MPEPIVLEGHALARLSEMPSDLIDVCATSPPYWGLRSYGTEPQVWGGAPDCDHCWGLERIVRDTRGELGSTLEGRGNIRVGRDWDPTAGESKVKRDYKVSTGAFCCKCGAWRGELGQEPTIALFIERMVEIFRDVRRVLKRSGTCWINMGDTRAGSWGTQGGATNKTVPPEGVYPKKSPARKCEVKAKSLCMIPFRLAIALEQDGWIVRDVIVWDKPNPMPESVRDRTTTTHEYILMLVKSAKYFYNADAIKEPCSPNTHARVAQNLESQAGSERANGQTRADRPMKAVVAGVNPKAATDEPGAKQNSSFSAAVAHPVIMRNARSVWRIPTQGRSEPHYASFPDELPLRCLAAGCPEGGTVLDPFAGRGTTLVVAKRMGLMAYGIELLPKYAKLARRNIANAQAPLMEVCHV